MTLEIKGTGLKQAKKNFHLKALNTNRDHDIRRWESPSSFGTNTKMWRG